MKPEGELEQSIPEIWFETVDPRRLGVLFRRIAGLFLFVVAVAAALMTLVLSNRIAEGERFEDRRLVTAIAAADTDARAELIASSGREAIIVFGVGTILIAGLFGVWLVLRQRQGRVLCAGRDITNLPPQQALQTAGITIVPQLRSVFPQMTVHENLELGMYLSKDSERIRDRIQYVYDLFPRLGERAKQMAGTMSGGEQRMLEIGRSLMWEPRLVLMIEQNARQGLEASHRGYVIEVGRQTYSGKAEELLGNDNVRRAFLGAA